MKFRGQFFLFDILSKIANYNVSYVTSSLACKEGYGNAPHAADRSWIKAWKDNTQEDILEMRYKGLYRDGNTHSFLLDLEGGILNCNQPLLNNTEVKLSFDRANAAVGLLFKEYGKDQNGNDIIQPTALDNKVLDLIEPYLEVEYVSSPYLRNYHAQIEEKPITMRYDDCDIYMKTVNEGQSMIRLNNICGGKTPDYIFAGFCSSEALNGDFNLSVNFKDVNITDVNISLNGMPLQGYPMSLGNTMKLYSKFLDTINRSKKSIAGESIGTNFFQKYYCLISHRFEGEQSNEGWLGLDVKLKTPLDENYTFGTLLYFVSNYYNLL